MLLPHGYSHLFSSPTDTSLQVQPTDTSTPVRFCVYSYHGTPLWISLSWYNLRILPPVQPPIDTLSLLHATPLCLPVSWYTNMTVIFPPPPLLAARFILPCTLSRNLIFILNSYIGHVLLAGRQEHPSVTTCIRAHVYSILYTML